MRGGPAIRVVLLPVLAALAVATGAVSAHFMSVRLATLAGAQAPTLGPVDRPAA